MLSESYVAGRKYNNNDNIIMIIRNAHTLERYLRCYFRTKLDRQILVDKLENYSVSSGESSIQYTILIILRGHTIL